MGPGSQDSYDPATGAYTLGWVGEPLTVSVAGLGSTTGTFDLTFQGTAATVPEPTSLALVGSLFLGLCALRRRV